MENKKLEDIFGPIGWLTDDSSKFIFKGEECRTITLTEAFWEGEKRKNRNMENAKMNKEKLMKHLTIEDEKDGMYAIYYKEKFALFLKYSSFVGGDKEGFIDYILNNYDMRYVSEANFIMNSIKCQEDDWNE